MPCAPQTGTFFLSSRRLVSCRTYNMPLHHWLLWTPGHWAKIVWGRNSAKGGKKWNRFMAESEMYVCFVKSSFKLQKEIMRVLSEIMYWWTSYTDHGQLWFFLWCAHIYTRTLQVHTSEWTGIAELLKKPGWSFYYGSRNTMFPSPASETLPWGQSLIIFSEHYF